MIAEFANINVEIKAEEKRMQFEKLTRTIELCDQFNNWITGYELPRDNDTTRAKLKEFKSWVYSDSTWNVNETEGIKKLLRNPYTSKFFNSFEKFKVGDKKDYIDFEYFQNDFETLFCAMKETKNPHVDILIESQRNSDDLETVWDGFKYCRDTLMTKRNK